ncbi:hypothetical protein NA56DRAFT_282416 [Hyaloscypha hepaticicola]|uniref:Uncharacterized protein n=1 Tax=Hyaloscypha hepaticicola TaxID=2082293 RepID=A0A2J6PSK2_9HELO|nr:hypothetical protein NA56DRAFT_282416 [Hyaloscypha hepaticicola]
MILFSVIIDLCLAILSLNGLLPPDSSRPFPSSFLASNSGNELLSGSLSATPPSPSTSRSDRLRFWLETLFFLPGGLYRCKILNM